MNLCLFVGMAGAASVGGLGKCTGDEEMVKTCHLGECDMGRCIDCEWNVWAEWGQCECTGLQMRHRQTKITNTACGKPCVGNRVETQTCHPACVHMPQDCVLGLWSEWSACDKTCGGGERSRKRAIVTEQQSGGQPCTGMLKDVDVCGGETCLAPTNCVIGDWSEWNECSRTCNGGQQERNRHVLKAAQDNGEGCEDHLSQYRGCNTQDCAGSIDCEWGHWVEWSACSATCGGGDRSRSRLIKVAPRHGGKLCEALPMSEVAPCAVQPCGGQDCSFAVWTEWDACSCSCNGVRTRSRHIARFPSNAGVPCTGSLKEIAPCNADNCEVEHAAPAKPPEEEDCTLSAWGQWEPCTHSCGGGLRFRSRSVTHNPANGGKTCDASLKQVEGCGKEACPTEAPKQVHTAAAVDCKWSPWDQWGACSATCNGGQRMRQRQISQMANSAGMPCKDQPAMEVDACNTHGCRCQDCSWSAWSEWAACTCTGIQEHHRSIQTHFNHCGKPCIGPKVETRSCNPDCENKKVDCAWTAWTEWNACTTTCGGGQQERTRAQDVVAQFGGTVCEGSARDIRPCGHGLCEEPIPCRMSEWDEWSDCSASCGMGERFRRRVIVQHPAYDGASCEGGLTQLEGCTSPGDCCTVKHCKWGQWSDFSACSVTCGGGYKTRDRQVVQSPSCGGKLCEALPMAESVPCNMEECSALGCVDGVWGNWGPWTGCSAECGGGTSSRERCIHTQANYCGTGVEGPMSEYRSCATTPCSAEKVDCEFGEWGAWGDCSCSCDGVRDRTREIAVYAQKGGKPCTGPIKQFEPCNRGLCTGDVMDCALSEWSHVWDVCSAKCGGGHQIRDRRVVQPSKNGGAECEGSIRQIHPCNMQACGKATDCEWGAWTDWSACSRQCGGGEQSRYRHITSVPKDGGKPCDKLDNVEVRSCNEVQCGEMQYCGWGAWSDWSMCSVSCGHGQSVRQRTLQITAARPEEVISSGVLDQMHSQLVEIQGKFTFDHLVIVYVFGALSTTLLLTSAYYIITRLPRRDSPTTLEMELLRTDEH